MKEKTIEKTNENKTTLFLYYSMQFTVLVVALFYFYEENWKSAILTLVIFLSMIIPTVLHRREKFYLPFTLNFGIVFFIFTTLFLGEIQNFYNRIPLWDRFLHFQSGILLAVGGFVLVYLLNKSKKLHLDLSPGFIAIFVITFAISVGTIWEIGEFFSDMITHAAWQAGLADTMWDLIADTGGAIIIGIAGYFWMLYQNQLPFTPILFRIFKKKQQKK